MRIIFAFVILVCFLVLLVGCLPYKVHQVSTSTYPYIKSPLLLIHATELEELSFARVKGISELKREIQDVTIVPIKETDHLVHWDQSDVVGDEMKQWIDRKASTPI